MRLTAHQLDTLRLYAQLGTYEAVADFRGVTVPTVGRTLGIVRCKLGVGSSAAAVAWLADLGRADGEAGAGAVAEFRRATAATEAHSRAE